MTLGEGKIGMIIDALEFEFMTEGGIGETCRGGISAILKNLDLNLDINQLSQVVIAVVFSILKRQDGLKEVFEEVFERVDLPVLDDEELTLILIRNVVEEWERIRLERIRLIRTVITNIVISNDEVVLVESDASEKIRDNFYKIIQTILGVNVLLIDPKKLSSFVAKMVMETKEHSDLKLPVKACCENSFDLVDIIKPLLKDPKKPLPPLNPCILGKLLILGQMICHYQKLPIAEKRFIERDPFLCTLFKEFKAALPYEYINT